MLSDKLVKGVAIRDHAYQPSLVTQWSDIVASNREILLACLRVCLEKSIDQTEELHHSFVLTDVFVAFQEENIFSAIVTKQSHFSWMLLT